jgi:hypothetical protein
VPEPSHHQPHQEHPHAFAIGIHDVLTGPPHEGQLGEGVLLRTDRGDMQAILHPAPETRYGVIWVGGARAFRCRLFLEKSLSRSSVLESGPSFC